MHQTDPYSVRQRPDPKATLGLRDFEGVAEGVHGGTVIVTMASRDRLHELHFGLATLRWR